MIAPDKNVENYAENLGLEVPQEWDGLLFNKLLITK